jgi:dihydroorotate dehydrogenase
MEMKNVVLGNAAGTCKTTEDLKKILSQVDTPTIGSITVEERPGNPGLPYWHHPNAALGSANKLGIPCRGLSYYKAELPHMVELAERAGKDLAVSIAALGAGHLSMLTQLCVNAKVPIIEVNEGCPNIVTDGKHKPIPSYDPESIDRDLLEVESIAESDQEIRVKLSPYFDSVLIDEVADVLKKHAKVVPVFCNTLPNVAMRDPGTRKLAIPMDGLGGHAGSDLFRNIVSGVIMQFQTVKRLGVKRRLIGAGGIYQGAHLLDYINLGVTEMQVGTAYYDTHDPLIFRTLREEYAATIEN